MKLAKKIGSGLASKAVMAAALMGGVLGFAGTASAHPRVVVSVGIGGPVVVRRYVAPAPVYFARPYYGPAYVAPRCGYAYYHRPRLRYWDARFACWRYR